MDMTPTNFNQYVRDQLKHRHFKIVMSERRRNGVEGLIPRADLHPSEIAREQRILSLVNKTNKYCVVAIDPDSGLFGAFQIFPPNGELPFEEPSPQAGPTSDVATTIASAEATKLHRAGTVATELADGIVSAEIRDYESLIENIPDGVDPELALHHLKQAKGKLMEIETSKGSFASGGYEQLRDTLPCKQHYTVFADVSKTEKGIKHDPSITFSASQNQPNGCDLPPMFKIQSVIQADIATSDKRAALKFIHFCLYQELHIKLELELGYAIATGRWSVKVVKILDSKEVIDNAKAAQIVFKDW